jgi:N-acetylneuraminic acid mutarotase
MHTEARIAVAVIKRTIKLARKLIHSHSDTHMWTKLQDEKLDPDIIACRSGHSTTAVGKKLFIFGGGSANETGSIFLNDITFYDVEQGKWHMTYAAGPTPAGRTKHTATLIGKKLYVFGGGDGLRLYNDLFCLDVGMPSRKNIEKNMIKAK